MTLHRLRAMHAAGEKIAMLTCYDATFARLLDAAGVECLLVGDSLGMVLQGHDSTVPVTLDDDGLSHAVRGARQPQRAWIVADLPFGSYQESREQALRSAARADAGRRAHGQARRRRLDAPRPCASWSSAASRCAPTWA